MTTVAAPSAAAPSAGAPVAAPDDHRGSWVPTGGMIATRFMELRKRRGLMIALVFVNIGLPTIFLAIRIVAHAIDPKSYGPAGGYDIFTNLVAGVMFVFGFIVAATLGCTAGSVDLTEGMFRHLVVTGRSRLALYFARIPAGLAIVVPMVAAGFAIVCVVCAFAAPTTLNYDGVDVPAGLTLPALEHWAADHADVVVCQFGFSGDSIPNIPCGNGPSGPAVITRGGGGPVVTGPGGATVAVPSQKALEAFAREIARQNYASYSSQFLSPPISLMIKTGLWLELEALIGFIVGLGLASLMGQRTVAVILMIVLEIILTPIFSRTNIPYMINLQRGVVGVAMAHIEPRGLPLPFGGGGGGGPGGPANVLIPEATGVAVAVIVGWLVVWTVLGAWRMATRDA